MIDSLRGLIGLLVILAGLHEPETECPDGLTCVAMATAAEANGESFLGQVAVARVIYERGPDSCEVIQEAGQFAGIEDWPVPRDPKRWGERAWRTALAAAWVARESDWIGPCDGATNFYAHGTVTPDWAGAPCVIGNHTFTTERKGEG